MPQSSGWDLKFGNCLNIIEKGINIYDNYVLLKTTKKPKNLDDNFTEKAWTKVYYLKGQIYWWKLNSVVLCWHFFHMLFWHTLLSLRRDELSSLSSVQVPMKSSKSNNRHAPFQFWQSFIMQQMIVIQIVFLYRSGISSPKVVASNDSGEIQAGTGDLVVSSMGKWSLNGAISSNPWNWNRRWVVTYARRFTTLELTNFSNRSRETKDSESNKSPFDIILYQHLAASHP